MWGTVKAAKPIKVKDVIFFKSKSEKNRKKTISPNITDNIVLVKATNLILNLLIFFNISFVSSKFL